MPTQAMESKAEVTRRLQRELRWKEASDARLREKVRLREEEGLSRQAANEASWEWMIETYPPLSEEEVDWTETWMWAGMSNGPITHPCVDAPGEVPFRRVWWVFCWLLARDDRIAKDDTAGANRVVRVMFKELPSADDAVFATLAVQHPKAFLAHASSKFERVIERLEADSTADPKLSLELSAFKEEIPGVLERLDTDVSRACDGAYLAVVAEEGETVFSGAPKDNQAGESLTRAREDETDEDDAPHTKEGGTRCGTEPTTV